MSSEKLTYDELVQIIAKYYNTDSTNVMNTLNRYEIPAGDVEQTFKLLEGTPYEIIYNNDGSIRTQAFGYSGSATTTASTAASAIDSNAKTALKSKVTTPINSKVTSGKATFNAGVNTAGKFVMTEVVPAIVAADVGITLGKVIDSTLYNANPNFWDSHGMSELNPETWASITSNDDSIGAAMFNKIFKIDPATGETQGYLDQDALAYMALYMQLNNILQPQTTVSGKPDGFPDTGDVPYPFTVGSLPIDVRFKMPNNLYDNILVGDGYNRGVTFGNPPDSDPDAYTNVYYRGVAFSSSADYQNSYTFDDRTVWYAGFSDGITTVRDVTVTGSYNVVDDANVLQYYEQYVAWLACYNASETGIDGISDQPNATIPDLSGAEDIDDVLALLRQQLPDLFNNAITQTVIQPDGSEKTYTYLPVGTSQANSATDNQPTTGTGTQTNTAVDPNTATREMLEYLIKLFKKNITDTDTETGGGDTPTVVTPEGTASALYKIYNPTQAQIDSFGAWLWSSNFVDQILKVFNNPMQAIIGLHKVFATPPVGGTANIKVGYLDSGVSSNYVSGQYTDIDCGTVSLKEKFNNVYDYEPFTEVHLYLPFIGIVPLSVGDVMRSDINVKYHVDVITGACLAEVNVIRDSAGGILYTFSGNAAVQYPLSSGSYMGIIASVASVAAGVAGSIASGGALAPIALGSAASLMNAHTNVQHSGSFSGNSGAMGVKKPYLIITRHQSKYATDGDVIEGIPENKVLSIGSLSGYVKVKKCHYDGITCTQNELNEIRSLMENGVYIN